MSLKDEQSDMQAMIVNIFGFQVTWFALVLGAANNLWVAGLSVALVWSIFHLRLQGPQWKLDMQLGVAAALLGTVLDSLLVLLDLLGFSEVAAVGPLTPPWMVALWVAFAFTLRHSLGWLAGRYVLAIAVGAMCGPLAYAAGQKLGAVVLTQHSSSLIAIALVYGLATPGLVFLRARLEASAISSASVTGGVQA